MAAYEAALSAERPPIGRKHKDGTIGDLVMGFYRSAYFENLKPRSNGSTVWCLTSLPERMATGWCATCRAMWP